jgi:[acyl-carrier-protein] S-malonyltransferase
MAKKIAFLFPGQGAQYIGMGKDFFEIYPLARETFEEADDLVRENLSRLIFEGPEETLTETRYAQVAIYVTSVALLRVVQDQFPGLVPSICSGLSLGEYTALHATKRLSFPDTLALVRERARLMNEACEKTEGTMAAVLGLDSFAIEAALQGMKGVWVANFNAPGQTVISGTKEGIENAAIALKERGAKRVLPLSVHGAFHSGLMHSAREGLRPAIERAPIASSEIAFCMNVPGDFVKSTNDVRDHLISQVTNPVRWEQGIVAMNRSGVSLYLEIGCGKILNGLNRKIGVTGTTLSVERVSDLETLAKHLEG